MTESKMHSSLFSLVDSHLSKSSLQENGPSTFYKIHTFNGLRTSSISESLLPLPTRPRLPIPVLNKNESPIQSVLADQIANMLKAREKKQQDEERQKLAEEIRRLQIEEEKNSVIDLMKVIQTPYKAEPLSHSQEVLSSSSSLESLLELQFTDCDGEPEKTKTPEPLLPCITDMSYILKENVNKARGSAFGKVLTSRLRPVVAPYLREKVSTNIARFDFSTPSPCDVIKANLRKPTMSCTFTADNITKLI